MSRYLLLKNLIVQNANTIAGMIYGFPSMTNFLGFAHALSRKLPQELEIQLGGVAVISHENSVHAKKPQQYGDYVFALTRNPLTSKGTTAPINEEGRMNMIISLLIEVDGLIGGDTSTEQGLIEAAKEITPSLRMAGGQIIEIQSISLTNRGQDQEQKVLRQLMPGFVLIDRSDYLGSHYQNTQAQNSHSTRFDAWCDFYTLKYKATPDTDNPENAEWGYVAKPNTGYLVPINIGYCAISDVYPAGAVDKVRDTNIPVVFAESAYGLGEWIGCHRISNIDDVIWRYEYSYPWYVAKAEPFNDVIDHFDDDESEV